VVIASHIVIALQTLVSRKASPKMPSVLTFGKIAGGTANNVIPDEVVLEGTFRTFDEKWRSEAKEHIRSMATGIASSMGAFCEVRIVDGYPFLENDPDYTDKMKQAAINFLGEDNVEDLDLWMAAEDFAYYSQQSSTCFYRLGVRNEKRGITSGVHTSTFDIDTNALKTGMGLMAWLAIQDLEP
jgi:amidohydrolase